MHHDDSQRDSLREHFDAQPLTQRLGRTDVDFHAERLLAAFVVLVEEAGGRFSDLWGGRRIDTATAVFTNGHHHDEICTLARTHAPQTPEAP